MQIIAGGGIVSLQQFSVGVGLVCLFSFLFVLLGRSLFYSINLFTISKASYSGYYYFIGLSFYLVLFKSLSSIGLSFTNAMMASLIFSACISTLVALSIGRQLYLKDSIKLFFFVLIAGCLSIFLLNVISSTRGGPIYAQLVEYIVNSNSSPLINRHYGQSLLGALILHAFRNEDLQLARMAVNLWLPISQLFLILIIYNQTESLFASKSKRIFICMITLAGNCALSLLPIIPIDHDFPLIFNVYADSVIGLGVSITIGIIVINTFKFKKLSLSNLFFYTIAIYSLFAALNITAEIDLLVVVASLFPVMLILLCRQHDLKRLLFIIITCAAILASLASSLFMGGIFMPAANVSKMDQMHQDLFSDSNAGKAVLRFTNPSHWYLPYTSPGLQKDFGNYESLFDGKMLNNKPYNYLLMNNDSFDDIYITKSKLARAIYLLELRVSTILKILFWPLLAFFICLWLLIDSNKKHTSIFHTANIQKPECGFFITQEGMLFSLTSFLLGLSVILLNSDPGNAFFWKWALTRISELGLFVMMMYSGILMMLFLPKIKTTKFRVITFVLLVIVLINGAAIRVFILPNMNG